MVKKKDIVKVFVIYLSLCHVSPAHPCGENPLRTLISISFKTGRLRPLKQINFDSFDWRLFYVNFLVYLYFVRQNVGKLERGGGRKP